MRCTKCNKMIQFDDHVYVSDLVSDEGAIICRGCHLKQFKKEGK